MNKTQYKKWFLNGGREIRQKYNKEYSKRLEVIERAKIKNARPDQRLNRKLYKQTEASKRANRKYRNKPETKEKVKNNRLKRTYGISLGEYKKICDKQKGLCAICGTFKEKLHIDHCHESNLVRGLLCGSCNRGIGMFKDNPEILQRAIIYLISCQNILLQQPPKK